MMTSDKCLNLYEAKKEHLDHKGIHDLISDFASIISGDMLDENPKNGFAVLKKGNNIWNYLKMELDKRGWTYLKQDGYQILIENLAKKERKKDGTD